VIPVTSRESIGCHCLNFGRGYFCLMRAFPGSGAEDSRKS
jgi:hypothetical protein